MTGRRVRLTIGLLLSGLLLVGSAPATAWAAAPDPRVVIVVGPVGGLTETYRSWGRAGAAEARRWTDDVVEIYSPNATWPRVRAALQGASVVVYLGHGNGFPSPYGTKLRASVQNGFGLNPVGGRGDATHQYFGEGIVAEQVRLAPGAVVLLLHLCYASGLAEPGVAEGSEATARQRVDNYAAGFLAAGASAVVADAYASPAPYLRTLLGKRASARTAWERAATSNGNVRAFESTRTPGAIALMDPKSASGGFARSLVMAAGTGGIVPSGPAPGESDPGAWEFILPPQPSVAPDAFDLGAQPGAPTLAGMPLADANVALRLPVDVPAGVALGTAYRLGTRWVPLDETGVTAEPAPSDGAEPGSGSPPPSAGVTAEPAPAGAEPATASPGPATTPPVGGATASPDPAGTEPAPADDPTLVARESTASRVDVVPATVAAGGLVGAVTLPAAIGRYRLEVTIHDRDGVAFPYAVQAAIPGLVVHVGGPGAAWLDAPPAVSVTAGTLASVQVVVTNGEAAPWGGCTSDPRRYGPDDGTVCSAVRLVGRWVPLEGIGGAPPIVRELAIPAASAQSSWLSGPVPTDSGTYLLVASLERSSGEGSPQVLGRPITVTVVVVSAPLVPTPAGD